MKYTEEQIGSMSEQESNVFAAKHVMNWNVDEAESERSEMAAVVECFEDGERCWRLFKPYSNIAEAMELLDALIAKGAKINIGYYHQEWDCYIDYRDCDLWMTGKTAAEAVTRACCLAAAMTGGTGDE